MTRFFIIIGLVTLVGCSCLGQLPPKIVVGDTLSCQAQIPDVMPFVTATANCSDVVQLYQVPEAGTIITQETILTVHAITDAGVETTKEIRIVPIFLDSARITITADFFAYEDTDVFQMFRVAAYWMHNYPQRYIDAIEDTTGLGYYDWKKFEHPNLPGPLYYSDIPMDGSMVPDSSLRFDHFRWTVAHW